MMGSSFTRKTWMDLFLKITDSNKDTSTIYISINQPPICAYKSGKSIKMDLADSITQFPTITSSLHASRVALSKQGPGMETLVQGSLRWQASYTHDRSPCCPGLDLLIVCALWAICGVLCVLSSRPEMTSPASLVFSSGFLHGPCIQQTQENMLAD